jgi:hypothetical protein
VAQQAQRTTDASVHRTHRYSCALGDFARRELLEPAQQNSRAVRFVERAHSPEQSFLDLQSRERKRRILGSLRSRRTLFAVYSLALTPSVQPSQILDDAAHPGAQILHQTGALREESEPRILRDILTRVNVASHSHRKPTHPSGLRGNLSQVLLASG